MLSPHDRTAEVSSFSRGNCRSLHSISSYMHVDQNIHAGKAVGTVFYHGEFFCDKEVGKCGHNQGSCHTFQDIQLQKRMHRITNPYHGRTPEGSVKMFYMYA